MPKAREPFDLQLDEPQRAYLGAWLNEEIQKADAARSEILGDVSYWWTLYEQGRTRQPKPGQPQGADLTSYLASEKVDALHARILRTIWSEPVWTVEGWGPAQERAPYVEEFHQWKVEEERLQGVLDKLVLSALVEPRALLEVAEGTQLRVSRKTITAKAQTDPTTGGAILGLDGQAQPTLGPDGKYVEATPEDYGVTMVIDDPALVRTGPVYRVLPYRDSLILPGHAREEADIWGYGKRIHKRYGELLRASQGPRPLYDREAVERMSLNDDRETTQSLQRSGQAVTPADEMAEKELWEVLLLLDLPLLFERKGLEKPKGVKDAGERWYLVTLHPNSNALLRMQFDDLERSRFVPVILFPRPDRATEGFSFVGHKLLTVIEEHTAVRNMRADREALVNNAPILRQQGALWDPFEQPWGPGAVIDVRAPTELQSMQVAPVSPSMIQWEQNTEHTAERLSGVNDISSGQIASESRTLGEIQMATTSSEIRMDLITRRLQESLEDLAQIRHAIWKRVLASQPEGVDAPAALVQNLEGRGVSIDAYLPDKKVTAALLEGAFKFKPHGSVETADVNRQRADAVGFLQFFPMFMQAFPGAAGSLQSPEAVRSLLRWVLQVFRVPNREAILGSPQQDLQRTAMATLAPMLMGMGGGPPGLALGGPGGPPRPGLGVPGGPGAGGPPSMPPSSMPPGVM